MVIDVRDKGKFGRTCLHKAAIGGHVELVKWLVSKGARVYAKSSIQDHQYTAIHYAGYFGKLDVVKFLIEKYPDLKLAKIAGGDWPMHVAALGNQIQVIKYFLKELAFDVNVRDEGKLGRTCLHNAALKGNVDLVKWLITEGANVFAKSSIQANEFTAVHLAANFGKLNAVKFLIEKFPALKSAVNVEGGFPIHVAALGNQLQVIKYFVEEVGMGIDVRDVGKFGRTFLHNAALKGHIDLVKWLVSKGANVYARSQFGHFMMPVHIAAFNGRLDVVKYFIENVPFLITARDGDGYIPQRIAELSNNPDVAMWLRSRTYRPY